MLPYWLLFSIFAFGAANSRLKPRSELMRPSPLLIGAAVGTALLIGLRYRVGADWYNYEDIFSMGSRLSLGALMKLGDPGYMLLMALAQGLGLEIWFVNLCCGLIFSWGLLRFSRTQPNPWLCFAVSVPYLIIVVAMGYSRQAVAIGLILASFEPFQRQQYGRFIACFFAAAAFHKSSIVVLPLIALSPIQHRFVIYSVSAFIGALMFFVFLDVFLDKLLHDYLESEMSSDGAGIRVAMNVVPALIFLAFQSRFVTGEQERLIWRNFALASLGMVAALVLLRSSTAVDRVALYLIPLQAFVLARVPYAFPTRKGENGFLMILVLVYSAAILGVWLAFAEHSRYWLPYRLYPVFG